MIIQDTKTVSDEIERGQKENLTNSQIKDNLTCKNKYLNKTINDKERFTLPYNIVLWLAKHSFEK